MTWIVALAVGWPALAVAFGLLLGRSIHDVDARTEAELRAAVDDLVTGAERTLARTAGGRPSAPA